MSQNDAIHGPSLRAALELFMPVGAVIELRALGVLKAGTCSGYFNNKQKAYEAAAELSGKAEGVYITLNPVNPDILARAANRAKPYARHTTSDIEITERRWLVIDIDPIRPKGISSTAEEHKIAHQKALLVRGYMMDTGFTAPVHASSGNGAHLLFDMHSFPNSPEARDKLKDALRGMAGMFNDAYCEIDVAMFNASRICRLYGTMARKGDPTPERPHRISRILNNPFSLAGDD